MEKKLYAIVPAIILCTVLAAPWNARAVDLTLHNVPAKVYFSPGGKQIEAIAREIDDATMEILIQSYSLDSPRIARALSDAAKRAVSVEVMLNGGRKSDKSGFLQSLMNARIPIYIDGSHGTACNEIIIIDKTTVIMGAFSLSSAAAQRSAENVLIIRSKDLAGLYLDNWLGHKQHCGAYQRKPAGKKKSKL
jgi:phosphatidylserine/phosphatidylglycerophosphate/cardiolipin synthase-like enzyme